VIRRFDIKGFKRFADNTFDFEPLIVLAGLNGTGKTSVIQALLLCRVANVTDHETTVPLNGGPFGLELGTAEDVHNRESSGDIVFSVHGDSPGAPGTWRFSIPSDTPEALYMDIAESANIIFTPFETYSSRRNFTYLSAERLAQV